jgi:two-component system OmpR family response regulator
MTGRVAYFDELQKEGRNPAATPYPSVWEKMRVLLVEDSRLLSAHLLEQLKAIPRVEPLGVVDTEKDAIDAIATKLPDLIVLDLHLRQGTGFGVLSALAKMKNAPISIVLTNYDLPQYRDRATTLGAKYFLDKSNEFDRLPTIISALIADRGIEPASA